MPKRSVKSMCGGAQAPYGLWMGNSRSGNHHPVKSHSFVLWLAARACALMQRKVLKTEWIEKRWAVIRMYGFTKLPLSSWEKQLSIQSGGRIRYESWRPRYMDVYGLPRRKLCARYGLHKIVFLARSLLKIREVCSENNSNQPAKQVMRRHEETVVWTRIRRNYKCSALLEAVHSMLFCLII